MGTVGVTMNPIIDIIMAVIAFTLAVFNQKQSIRSTINEPKDVILSANL